MKTYTIEKKSFFRLDTKRPMNKNCVFKAPKTYNKLHDIFSNTGVE